MKKATPWICTALASIALREVLIAWVCTRHPEYLAVRSMHNAWFPRLEQIAAAATAIAGLLVVIESVRSFIAWRRGRKN